MSPAQVVLSQLVKVALVAALAGTFARGRYRACLTFPVYLALVLACDTVVSLWPERFYVEWFWILQQSAWDLAKLAVALELACRVFRVFPGARSVAHVTIAAVLAITTAVIIALPAWASYTAVAQEWQPRVLTGTIWLMTSIAILVVWYRLPIHPFQRAILIGFVPYLAVFSSLLNVLRHHGWEFREWVNVADASAYLLAASWWAWSAWRRDEVLEASPELLRRLRLDHV